MVKTLALFFAVLAASSATEISAGDIFNLTSGFLLGLEANSKQPGPCYKAIASISNDFEAIASDVSRITKGDEAAVTQFITDITGTVTDLRSFNGTCDFSGLETQIKALLSPEGAKIISENYLKHVIAINKDIATIKVCSSNYFNCGKAAGEIVRDITTWSLNSYTARASKNDPESFFTGLITGLEKSGSDVCAASLNTLNTDSFTLIEDIQKVIGGNYSVLPSIMIKLNSFKNEISKSTSECDFGTLVTDIDNLFTPEGIKAATMNYLTNVNKIQTYLKSIEVCSTNYNVCGNDLAQIVKLMLGWSI